MTNSTFKVMAAHITSNGLIPFIMYRQQKVCNRYFELFKLTGRELGLFVC